MKREPAAMLPCRGLALARLATLIFGVVVFAATGAGVAPAAAGASSERAGEQQIPPEPVPWAGQLPDLDCALEDIDDRCETWTAIYDDSELYSSALLTIQQEPWAEDVVREMAVSPTGDRVFTLGLSCRRSFPTQCRWAVVAHGAGTGDELWVAHEETTGAGITNTDLTLVDLAVSSDGRRVYATGRLARLGDRPGDGNPLENAGSHTIAWEAATGRKLWEHTYSAEPIGHRKGDPHDLHSRDAGVAVAPDPTGEHIYVIGYTEHRDGFYDAFVIAYDGVYGTRELVATYDTSTAEHPYADDKALTQLAQVSPDGTTLYMTVLVGGSEGHLLAYQIHNPQDPTDNGALLWTNDDLSGHPEALVIAPDGARLYLIESREIAAYDAVTGAEGWVSRASFDGTPSDLAVSPEGDLIVVTGVSSQGYITIAYDAETGERAWDEPARYDDRFMSTGAASSVGMSPDGTMAYVTGASTSPARNVPSGATSLIIRQTTVAYDAETGEPRWIAKYVPPPHYVKKYNGGSENPLRRGDTFLDIGPDGVVYTAGTFHRTLESGSMSIWTEGYPTKNYSDWALQAYNP